MEMRIPSGAGTTLICRINIQTAPRDIYGIPPGYTLAMYVRIPVPSPYIKVRIDTSGPYALVKERMIIPESAHPNDTQVTRTLYTSRTKLISTVYPLVLRAELTRHVQDLQAHFTRLQFTPPPTLTINAI